MTIGGHPRVPTRLAQFPTLVVSFIVSAVLSSVLVAAFATPAQADNKDTSYFVYYNTVDWCVKGRALLRHPSLNGGYILDYNAYSQSWNGSCSSLVNAPANYHYVSAQLLAPNGAVCRSFGYVSNPSSTMTWGIGAPANAYCGAGNYKVKAFEYFISPAHPGNQTTGTHNF